MNSAGEYKRRWALLLAILLHDVPWKPWAVTGRLRKRQPLVLESLPLVPESLREGPGGPKRVAELLRELETAIEGKIERNDREALALIAWMAERLEAYEAREAARTLLSVVKEEWERSVHEADILAASIDRQIHPTRLNASRFTNIFYPGWTRSLYPLTSDDLSTAVPVFLMSLDRLVYSVIRRCSDKNEECVLQNLYLALYSMLEKLWHDATDSKTMPAADTRIPHHTVFEHVRAAASALALRKKSLIALIDIPNVHKFISAARKTRDFWAGSWLISLLAWASVKGLVEKVGPQSVLSPALQINPFYLDLIAPVLEEGDGKLLSMSKNETPYIAWKDGWPSQPLMPATLLLLLDPEDSAFRELAGGLGCRGEDACSLIECIIEESLRRAWESLWIELRHRVQEIRSNSGEAVKICHDPLHWDVPRGGTKDRIIEGALRLICLHAHTASPRGGLYDYFKALLDYLDSALREPPVGVKVTCAVADYSSGDYQDFINEVIKHLNSIKIREEPALESIRELLKPVGIEFVLNRSLRLAYALAILEEARRESPNSSPPHFLEAVNAVQNLWKHVMNSQAGANAFRYCSLCGQLPAVARMPRLGESVALSGTGQVEFDSDLFEKMLGATGYLADEGESFCPYCLLKRMLSRAPQLASRILTTASKAPESSIHSVLLTANEWTPEAVDLLETVGHKIIVEKIIEGLAKYRYVGAVYGDGDNVGKGLLKGILVSPEALVQALPSEERNTNYDPDEVDTEFIRVLGAFCGAYDVDSADALLNILVKGVAWWEIVPPLAYYSFLYSSALGGGRPPCQAVLANAVLVVATSRALRSKGLLTPFEAPSVIITPSYLQALSTALMTTALVDAVIVSSLKGTLVYAGGDDILAILPSAHDPSLSPLTSLEQAITQYKPWPKNRISNNISLLEILERITGIDRSSVVSIPWLTVAATRLNYWGLLSEEKGFHVYNGIVAQAVGAHGRSYGLVIAHYKTPLWITLQESHKLVELKDQYAVSLPGGVPQQRLPTKDFVVVGYSRESDPAAVPESSFKPSQYFQEASRVKLSAGFKLVSSLYAEIQGKRAFTNSLVYDMLSPHIAGLIRRLYTLGSPTGVRRLVEHVLHSNIKNGEGASRWITTHMSELNEASSTGVSHNSVSEPLLQHSFMALRYLLAGSRGWD